MAVPFEKFIKVADFFYTFTGTQPCRELDKNRSKTKWLLLQVVFYVQIFNLNAHIIGQAVVIYVAYKMKTGFVECVFTAAVIGFVTVAVGKLISIWYRQKVLTSLIGELKELHPKALVEQEAYKLESYLRPLTAVMTSFSLLFSLLVWIFNFVPLAHHVCCLVLGQEPEQHFVYDTYVPWEWRGTAWFWIIIVSQNVAGHQAGAAIIASDTLLCALVVLVCMHFDHLAQQLEEYIPSGGEKDMQFIGSMIAYHQKLLRLSDQINSIFGIPLLLNFAASSVIICFVGFQVSTGLEKEDLFKFVLYLLSALIQVYLICYYGEMMTQASGNIAQALYNQVWYMKASTSYKKCLLCMMHKAQMPLHLRATVFLPVSMNAFTQIGQISYKFFTLLRTMYAH